MKKNHTIYQKNECTLIAVHELLEDNTDFWVRDVIKENNNLGFPSRRNGELADRYNLIDFYANDGKDYVTFSQSRTLAYINGGNRIFFLRTNINVMASIRFKDKLSEDGSFKGHSLTVKLTTLPYISSVYCIFVRRKDIIRIMRSKNVNSELCV